MQKEHGTAELKKIKLRCIKTLNHIYKRTVNKLSVSGLEFTGKRIEMPARLKKRDQ